MARNGYKVQDDSVTVPVIKASKYAGKSSTVHGEKLRRIKREAGVREERGGGRSGRPVAKPTARFATSVNPQNPIDPQMPVIQVP